MLMALLNLMGKCSCVLDQVNFHRSSHQNRCVSVGQKPVVAFRVCGIPSGTEEQEVSGPPKSAWQSNPKRLVGP